MSRESAHLSTAVQLMQTYKGAEPFAVFLKRFFSQHKKHGSRDRKQIAQYCYAAFRLGHLLNDAGPEERVLAGLFLTGSATHPLLQELRPEWQPLAALPFEEKIRLIAPGAGAGQLFPALAHLSAHIQPDAFAWSHLQQPRLFLRVRPGHHQMVTGSLKNAGVDFEEPMPNCIAVPNGTPAEQLLHINQQVVVQDFSSQRVAELLRQLPAGISKVWDCCAASGGKSILMHDLLPGIKITVSDNRTSILSNLKTRFAAAGIRYEKLLTLDLLQDPLPCHTCYDLVLADVPCSGSGTWGRTPEQLYYFQPESIQKYAQLQTQLAARLLPAIKPGGFLLYCTCSVYREENEQQVQQLVDKHGLQLLHSELLTGYRWQADTLYAALLQKK